MPDYASQRSNMVVSQALASGVTDERILTALRKVERERFVPATKRALAYAESAVEVAPGRYLLDPRTFALMLTAAGIGPADRVLDVGCATGYSAAVLGCLCASVIALEQDADLVRIAAETILEDANVSVAQGSLAEGHRAGAPYDVIFINGAVQTVPEALLTQLADGGRLIAVVRKEAQGHAVVFLKEHGRIGRRIAFDAAVPLLVGFRQPAGFVF